MIAKRIRDYLDDNGISYEVVNHDQAFTAQKIAASAHISGKEVAKTVIVKVDGDMLMVVLPAHRQVDLMKLKQFLKADEITLAEENEFQELFPDCEVGAMPPLGNLYDIPVYVTKRLTEDETIAFEAGSHRELIKMRYSDFANIVHPIIGQFSLID